MSQDSGTGKTSPGYPETAPRRQLAEQLDAVLSGANTEVPAELSYQVAAAQTLSTGALAYDLDVDVAEAHVRRWLSRTR